MTSAQSYRRVRVCEVRREGKNERKHLRINFNQQVLDSSFQRLPIVRNGMSKNALVSRECLDTQSQQRMFLIMQHDSQLVPHTGDGGSGKVWYLDKTRRSTHQARI